MHFLHNKFIKLYHITLPTSINCQCIFFIFCFFLVTIFSSTQEQTSRTKSIAEHCNLQFSQADLPTCDTCVQSANLSGKQYEKTIYQEVAFMSANNSSSGSNRMAVPEAKEAMKRFKEEVASEIGVPLKDGYNGDLTSKQAGSIGGEMVKKMIMKQEQQMQQ